MDNENRFRPESGSKELSEVREITSKEEIEEYFAFSDPILEVDWGNEGPPEEYQVEYISDHPDFTRIFVIKDKNGDLIAGAKIKKLDEETKERLGLDKGYYGGKQGALLEYTAVAEKYRNQKLLVRLTEKRIDWAKEHGADYTCTEIGITNPISAYTKIRDGYIFLGIKEPGAGIPEPYFVMVKPIVPSPENRKEDRNVPPNWKEVEVKEDSFDELKGFFSEGWVGVDMKFEDPKKPWTIILEKVPE